MSGNDYGNLGNEMKALKDTRKNFMAQTKAQDKKLKAETHQFLTDADKMMAGIAKDVAGLKAGAQQKLAEHHTATAEMTAQMRQTLSPVKTDLEAQHRRLANDAGKMMTGVRKNINALKAEAGQIVADAASMMNGLAKASRERAAAWRDVLGTVHGNGHGAPARASSGTAVMEPPTKTKPRTKSTSKTRSTAKKRAPAKKR